LPKQEHIRLNWTSLWRHDKNSRNRKLKWQNDCTKSQVSEDLLQEEAEPKRLNEQVKRNMERFPEPFCFQLTVEETESLRSQNATLEIGRGKHRKYLPYVFSEQGVAMLSAVLHSETAVKVSIQIMNAFVAMRRFLRDNAQVFQRLDTLELKQIETDKKVARVLSAIEDKTIGSS